jgi:hypothetical protein
VVRQASWRQPFRSCGLNSKTCWPPGRKVCLAGQAAGAKSLWWREQGVLRHAYIPPARVRETEDLRWIDAGER